MSGALYHDENDWGEPPGDRGASGVFAPVFSSLAVAVLLIAVKTSLATLKSPDGSSFPVHIEWTIARHAAEMTTCGPTVQLSGCSCVLKGVLRSDAQPHREADRDKHARTHARTHAQTTRTRPVGIVCRRLFTRNLQSAALNMCSRSIQTSPGIAYWRLLSCRMTFPHTTCSQRLPGPPRCSDISSPQATLAWTRRLCVSRPVTVAAGAWCAFGGAAT